jgi:hypothetical protein
MDSMRHLSTSLPQTSRQQNDRTVDLLPDFKQAALSVTNLYKAADQAQRRARTAGYQDALEDILTFLDRENLGLMDGEGWRVRQWATQNLDGSGGLPQQAASAARSTTDDDGDERASNNKDEEKEEETCSSPEAARQASSEDQDSLRRRVVSEPPQVQTIEIQHSPPRGDFTFVSQHAFPSNHERNASSPGMELDTTSGSTPIFAQSSIPAGADIVRQAPRSSRPNRHTNHSKRTDTRPSTLNFNLGNGAGSKRKLPYSDFFDISGFGEGTDRKDGASGGAGSGGSPHSSRGGKRGRHV